MPKAYKRRSTYRSPRPRTRRTTSRRGKKSLSLQERNTLLLAIGAILLIAFILSLNKNMSTQHNTTTAPPASAYSVVGPPTINADFINRVLDHYHSPATGTGQTLYDDGVKYNIDPAYALAFFMQESTLGTQGIAKVTHSLGNIRATSDMPQYNGYRRYDTWEDGFEDWYKLISQLYIKTWGLTTVDQIIPVYAPAGDNNNEAVYEQTVKNFVVTWRKGSLEA